MTDLTIENFWKVRLKTQPVSAGALVQGWSFLTAGLTTFKEAPLTVSGELGSGDPTKSPVVLVSAPGAVGKSTLARQIAFATGAVYIDLAKARPVGGDSLSGGLVKSGLYQSWDAQTTAILVDGLDEARLRVTEEGFRAFLADIAELSRGREVPIVLFGRTGAVEESWLVLTDQGAEAAVVEIGYFGSEASVDFAEARLREARPNSPHAAIERRAVELLLSQLREQTERDGDRFAGYAPVLQAVADRVAREKNLAAFVSQIEQGEQPVTLKTVALAILEREHGKLDPLVFEDAKLHKSLYLPEEQLDRLVALKYDVPPPVLPSMSAKDAETYASALDTWVADHPFLKGTTGASSVVFDAMIVAHALKHPTSSEVAVQRELGRGAAANPFLAEFYAPDIEAAKTHIPPEHIGIIYASLRAQLSLSDFANLIVEGPEEDLEEDEQQALSAEVEITVERRNSERSRTLLFATDQTGTLRLGAYVEDVEIFAPHAHVEIGPGAEAVLVAPISIQCQQITLSTNRIIAESPVDLNESSIFLEADAFDGTQMASAPTTRGNVSLSATWPGVRGFPWTAFATEPLPVDDPRLDEALRRFRKFVISFRSHSKGNLGRYKHKIEHARMTKGTGQAVLDLLVSEGILTLKGTQYSLDPDKLGEVTGANYGSAASRNFSAQTVAFVKRALG